ncbi:MAG: hypothetical protein GEV13_26335 [Rhodospirillales bacterium]|nr:hypothetical protein [Rhodospirillales bacterium]
MGEAAAFWRKAAPAVTRSAGKRRDAAKLAGQPPGIEVVAADPTNAGALRPLVAGQQAVVFSLGTAL